MMKHFNQIRSDLTSQIDPNAVTPTVVSDTPGNSNSSVINPSSPTPAPSAGGGGGGRRILKIWKKKTL